MFINIFMKFVDTHAHLDYFIRRNQLSEIIADAKSVGLVKVIVASASPENWSEYEKLLNFANAFDNERELEN